VPDAFAVIADRVGGDGLYTSNASVIVYKLLGVLDPRKPSPRPDRQPAASGVAVHRRVARGFGGCRRR